MISKLFRAKRREMEELVLVTKAELDELRQLKTDLPTLLEKARKEGGMKRLKTLHDQQRADPTAYAEKARQRYHAKKAEVLARRRELYRAKKATATAATAATAAPKDTSNTVPE